VLRIAIFVGCLAVAACAGDLPADGPRIAMNWACPAAGTTARWERHDLSGTRVTTWLGADPSDPDVCLVNTPDARRRGRPERRVFNWISEDQVTGTAEERQAFVAAFKPLLNGQVQRAHFILRTPGNVQLVYQWKVVGRDPLVIDGRRVDAIKLRVDHIFGANTAMSFTELWWDPDSKLFVRIHNSLEFKNRDYQIVHISTGPEQAQSAPGSSAM
jgi:hypothetical protein